MRRKPHLSTILGLGIIMAATLVACGDDEPVDLRPSDVAAAGMVQEHPWEFFDGITEPVDDSDEVDVILADQVIGGCGYDGSVTGNYVVFRLTPETGLHDVTVSFSEVDDSGFSFSAVESEVEITETADGAIFGSLDAERDEENYVEGDFAALDCH